MAYRSPARWLAPLALLGSVAAIMIVISSSSSGSDEPQATAPGIAGSTTTSDTATTDTTETTPNSGGRRSYTVEEGDTLSAIADKTGVPLDVIEELNPKIDAQTLRAGQRIKLRP